jgi:adhesin transport system membrane fusion protein
MSPVEQSAQLEQVTQAQRQLLASLLLGCAAFIVWAALSPLDILSIANGTVKPASRVQTVQHLEGGIVRKLLIREGDTVKQGQALIELETKNIGALYGEILVRVNTLTADHARLQAEEKGAEVIAFDDTFRRVNASLVARTISLFRARQNQLNSSLKSQQEEINVRTQVIQEVNTRAIHSVKRLKLVQEQIAIEKRLLSNALSNRYEHLERLKEVNRLESDIAEGQASLNKAKASLAQAIQHKDSIQTTYNEEVSTALSTIRSKLDEGKHRLDKYKDNLARTVLRAPMDGIIKSLYVVTEGGVIAPGGIVVDMVPGKEGLVVKAKLPPQDIGHVSIGQRVFIQLASAEASHYGRIVGDVTHISPDTTISEEGDVYYPIRIGLSNEQFEKGQDKYRLSSGVIVTVGIVTGKRSVLEYVLSPFIQTLPFSLTEG